MLAELDGHVDKIVALDNGRLVEEGSAQKLLAKGGLFARLYSTAEKPRLTTRKRRLKIYGVVSKDGLRLFNL
ncbi:MAG: hypothetical protein LBL45_13400 [Treponema sp.]|nr:hypothetical protein [Treponema sp.]